MLCYVMKLIVPTWSCFDLRCLVIDLIFLHPALIFCTYTLIVHKAEFYALMFVLYVSLQFMMTTSL